MGAEEVTTRITSDTNLVQEAVSGTVGVTLIATLTFVAAFIIGFIKFWRLTLILTSTAVAFVLTLAVLSHFIVNYNTKYMSLYTASGPSRGSIGIIRWSRRRLARSVMQSRSMTRSGKPSIQWSAELGSSVGIPSQGLNGIVQCFFIMCYVYLTYSLVFWQESRYLVKESSTSVVS